MASCLSQGQKREDSVVRPKETTYEPRAPIKDIPTTFSCSISEMRHLHGLGPREEAAVDSIDDRLRGNNSSAEESTVKSFDGVLAALNSVELKVDVALRVRIYSNVNNVTVFVFALSADIVFKFLNPVVTLLPIKIVSCKSSKSNGEIRTQQGQTYSAAGRICWPWKR